MSSSQSQSTLPISNTAVTGAQPVSTATPALRAFISRLTDSLRHAFSNRRPWLELIDRNSFSKPESLSEATSRIRKNYTYFRINYLTLLATVLAFSLISHPFSLLTLIGLLAAWLFLYLFRPADQPLVVLGRVFSSRETLGILVIVTVVVVFLTSFGSLLISAVLIGMLIVCVHGAFRVPEDLFLDDQEYSGPGLLNLLGGAATTAAAAGVV